MKKSLVLAEKPSVGKNLARVLGCRKAGDYYENEKYIITWALGHLVTLADPEIYNEKYQSWRLEDLPILPEPFKLVVIKKTARQFNLVKKLLREARVEDIIIATDAEREGELVARWIINKAGVKKPLKRLWISSVTDLAIKNGFAGLKNGTAYDNLYAAAAARSKADWVVGINATRALTCKFNAQLSCGRVQTPTLAIIAHRENEIENFKPRPYYGLSARADSFNLTWQERNSSQTRTFSEQARDDVYSALQGKEARVTEITQARKQKQAPALYNLTELQLEANRRFDYAASFTLSVMQSLYETHKLVTYPRTDSRYLTSDITGTLKERVEACASAPYRAAARQILSQPVKVSKNFVDDSRVSSHHAIIPTEERAYLNNLSQAEKNIYDLIVRRFLAMLSPPFVYVATTIKTKIGEESFVARGKTVLQAGWQELYQNVLTDEEEEEQGEEADLGEQLLPALAKGDTLKITAFKKTSGQTRPPARFNEGRLLKAMENPAGYMALKGKEMVKSIAKAGGLGTVATRADIIEKLYNSFLIEQRGKEIFITSKGKQLLELVPEDLKTPDLTARWELKLEEIAGGKLNPAAYLAEMKQYAGTLVAAIKSSDQTFKHDNLTGNRCPGCGRYLLEVKTKKGRMLVCQDRQCGYRDLTARISNARCPQCHKKLELRGSGSSQIFVCPCGYREKLAALEKRKQKEGKQVSKKEVPRFLKEQEQTKTEPLNTALAEALQKLKEKQP